MKSISSTCTCCCFCCRRWCERKLFGSISSQLKFIAVLSSTFWLFIVHVKIVYHDILEEEEEEEEEEEGGEEEEEAEEVNEEELYYQNVQSKVYLHYKFLYFPVKVRNFTILHKSHFKFCPSATP